MNSENDDLAKMFLLTIARLYRLQDRLLGQLEIPLTSRQYRILSRISDGHDTMTPLSQASGRTLPTVSESVEGLVKRKLVKRFGAKGDRRMVVLKLTSDGKSALQAAELELQTFVYSLLRPFGENIMGDLSKALHSFSNYFEEKYPTQDIRVSSSFSWDPERSF